ncbi:MAG: methyltransferase domain-containing protein [Actinomycetota bacterium]
MSDAGSDDVREHRDWLASLVPIPERGLWVDLGCGRGDDVLTVASLQPSADLRLIGIDSSMNAIAAARSGQAASDSRIEFRAEKIEAALPFASGSVDVVFSNNLVECLSDPEFFAREIGRILKPGGWAIAAHWDWDSQIWDAHDKSRVRRLVQAFADWQQGWMDHSDGWMGRRLWGVFNGSGLFRGSIHARVMTNTTFAPPWYGHARVQDLGALVQRGLASEADYTEFVSEQDDLSATGKYFYGITGFAYVGKRTSSA